MRRALFHVLQRPSRANPVARYASYLLTGLILANAAAVAIETVPSIYEPRKSAFFMLEAVSTVVFAVEYLLRIWVCVEDPKFAHPLRGRLRYALRPLPILDLIVVATYFAPMDLRFLRIFRLMRLLRVLNLDALDESLRAVGCALHRRRQLLVLAVSAMAIAVYCFAAVLYMVEHRAQPDIFASIPDTLWWAVVTLTTIGYGDMTPITPLGKLLSGFIVVFGIGVFALPTAIVTAAIIDAGTDRPTAVCPHCGKELE